MTNNRNYNPPGYRALFPEETPLINSLGFNGFIKTSILKEREIFYTKFITKLSQHPITATQLSILHRGLNFVPTPRHSPHIIDTAISKTTSIYNRHKYFENHPKVDHPKPHPFHVRSSWSAPDDPSPPLPPTAQEYLQSKFNPGLHHQTNQPNLTQEETNALSSIINNSQITIKRSDKGGGITIMDTNKYINQIQTDHL